MNPNTLRLQAFVQKIFKPRTHENVLLGRWRLNYSEDQIAKTIERANEDHCGTCILPPPEKKTLNLKNN